MNNKQTNKQIKLIDTENRLAAARDGAWRVEEMCELFVFLFLV